MVNATFRFYAELNDFVPRRYRDRYRCRDLTASCARDASVKHSIEALGVPHTEVALVLVNGESSSFERPLAEGDRVAAYPAFGLLDVQGLQRLRSWPAGRPRFVADAHLGGLARLLRMAGYDSLYDNGYHDDEIERIAREQGRVLLSRDRELLKRRSVEFGCYLHAIDPPGQLRELFARLRLAAGMRPFSLCLHCSLPLHPVDRDAVLARLPPRVAASPQEFTTCAGCHRVYWEGSHHERMRRMLAAVASGGEQGTDQGGAGAPLL